MDCPRCGAHNAKYVQRRDGFTKTGAGDGKKTFKRTEFGIKCKKCGIFDERELTSKNISTGLSGENTTTINV